MKMKMLDALLVSAATVTFLVGCGDSSAKKPASKWAAAGTVSLKEAAFSGNVEAIKQHIAAGSNLNERNPKGGGTPLMTAAIFDQTDAAKALIKGGADLNLQDNKGSTALINAALFGRTDLVKALLEAGADKNLQDKKGSSALINAAFFGRTDLVKALVDAGADKTLKNNAGSTALETVQTPFETLKPIYDYIGISLAPLGLKLDYAQIQAERPKIVKLLE